MKHDAAAGLETQVESGVTRSGVAGIEGLGDHVG